MGRKEREGEGGCADEGDVDRKKISVSVCITPGQTDPTSESHPKIDRSIEI